MESSNPKISVIVPIYNRERFLDETISSVLNQTFKEFELILVNDASTDNSLKLMKEYSKRDKRIKILSNKKNLGVSGTINKGIKASKGKYVAILGSDDLFLKSKLEMQYDYLEKHPEIFLVGTSAIYVNGKGEEIRRFRKYNSPRMLSWRLTKSCGIIHSSTVCRNTKEFWYNPKFKAAIDYNFYLDLLEAGKKITNLPLFLTKYRVHKNSISISRRKEQEKFANLARENHKNLNEIFNFIEKIIFSVKLIWFYLSTLEERRVKS